MSDNRPPEADEADRQRAMSLLREPGSSSMRVDASTQAMLSAYIAVLLKDIRWSLNELLAYKINEVHK